jgi:hypothetical protein
MKIRNGFVTNSSSSSFIISVRSGGKFQAAENLIKLFKFMVDETYFDWHNIINNIEELGDIMDVQELMEKDKFCGHYELQERIENQDTTLLGKQFYDLTFERSWEELRDILFDLINSIDGMKIESRDIY